MKGHVFRNEAEALRAYDVYTTHGGRKAFGDWLAYNEFTYS